MCVVWLQLVPPDNFYQHARRFQVTRPLLPALHSHAHYYRLTHTHMRYYRCTYTHMRTTAESLRIAVLLCTDYDPLTARGCQGATPSGLLPAPELPPFEQCCNNVPLPYSEPRCDDSSR